MTLELPEQRTASTKARSFSLSKALFILCGIFHNYIRHNVCVFIRVYKYFQGKTSVFRGQFFCTLFRSTIDGRWWYVIPTSDTQITDRIQPPNPGYRIVHNMVYLYWRGLAVSLFAQSKRSTKLFTVLSNDPINFKDVFAKNMISFPFSFFY